MKNITNLSDNIVDWPAQTWPLIDPDKTRSRWQRFASEILATAWAEDEAALVRVGSAGQAIKKVVKSTVYS